MGKTLQFGVFKRKRDEKLDALVALAREPLNLEEVDLEDPTWRWGQVVEPYSVRDRSTYRIWTESFDYDESQHPRDDHGRWTDAEDGGGADGEKPIPPSEMEPLKTDDIQEAAKALAEGRRVILNQPDEVSTLITELGRMAAEAQAAGREAPKIDLGLVSVPGTNLFTQDSLGIPRVDMPQLKGVPLPGSPADALPRDSRGEVDIAPGFYQSLVDKGVGITQEDALVSHLRATQKELDGVKVAGIMNYVESGGKIEGSIPVSRDGYVVDGHHRWAADIGIDYKTDKDPLLTMPVNRIDESITEILQQAKDYAKEQGIPQAGVFRLGRAWVRIKPNTFGFETFDYDESQHPRDERGRWTDADGGGSSTAEKAKPDMTAADRKRYNELKRQWSTLDRQLSPYVTNGNVRSPEAQKLIQQQMDCVKEMHTLHCDQGGAAGVGYPGGPRDVVIVGAGPAGLQAAINGGTEGLDTLMVDQSSDPGGQIGMTSRTENVLGFPAGISGEQLAQDGLTQAQRCGAETRLGVGVTGMTVDPATGIKTLSMTDGSTVDARSVVIAGGVQFRTLDFPGNDSKGIVYGDSGGLKQAVQGGNAVIVGGGNSAGQAAVDLANSGAAHTTLLVRGDDLTGSMSPYLINQMESDPNTTIRYHSEIASASPDENGNVGAVTLKDGTVLPTQGVGLFIGSAPRTDWAGAVERDDHGFIKTGGSGSSSPLETSIPGVYAAGDVRSGSMHRVVAAAGEGGLALASAWQHVHSSSTTAAANMITVFAKKGLPQITGLPTPGAPIVVNPVGPEQPKPKPRKRKEPENLFDPKVGNDFLDKVKKIDNEQPFTGYDPITVAQSHAGSPFPPFIG